PETGYLSGSIAKEYDEDSSGGSHIVFDKIVTDDNFQPTAPYYSTFFYLWYKNPETNGGYSYWNDSNKNPPKTWFSYYLPDVDPQHFDPAKELYSSTNYNAFKWQVSKMAQSKIEVAIASWWGINRKEDEAFNTIINDYMARTDNPYPNLRFAIYYEKEAINPNTSPNTTPYDPNVDTEIVPDLNYIIEKYGDSPYLLRINDKPVLFVYADSNDKTDYVKRWVEANAKVGKYFYLNLKVFDGYQTFASQVDSWHQYAPATRGGTSGNYYYYVSPGFHLVGNNERLCRNLNGNSKSNCQSDNMSKEIPSFESELTNMVNSNTTWKLIETWNEWGEGTAIEPGVPTTVDSAGNQVLDPSGVEFGNAYVDILNTNLPNLEGGTGRPQ
ncbi:MAG: hypothetical protein U0525_03980, partial [Patescibacteria group bacterium]